jgi:hypothetical protein
MEKKQITAEMKAKLNAVLPAEAIKQHPTKSYLSTINAIYVSERLNEVFGVGEWQTKAEYINEKSNKTTMVVVKLTLDIPAYGIHYECYGGNDNADYGDAFKGATTDALTKIGSWMGIGAHVWKNDPTGAKTTAPQPAPAPQPTLTKEKMEKIVIDYLYSNEKAENHYLNKYQVKDMLELNLMEIYHELKSHKKITNKK